jgi:hypothetical protein
MKHLLLTLTLLTSFFASAQTDFLNHLIIDNTFSVFYISCTVAIDVDDDGDLDLVSGASSGDRIAWQENIDGLGTFGDIKIITENAKAVVSLIAADVDNDGDLDLISASKNNQTLAWYENRDGTAGFGPQRIISSDLSYLRTAAASDVDGDGDLDILISAEYNIKWFENIDGAGSFGNLRTIDTDAWGSMAIATADLDGDGDMDVISNTSSTIDNYIHINWYENLDGQGTFGTPTLLYDFASEPNYSVYSKIYTSDLDDDGDSDILFFTNHEIWWVENTDGQATFENHLVDQRYQRNRYMNLEVTDMDEDGDLDIASAGLEAGDPDRIAWFENTDGEGTFGSLLDIARPDLDTTGILVADLDGDGKKDITKSAAFEPCLVWYKKLDNQGNFDSEQVISKFFSHPKQAQAIDVDGDGDLDVLYLVDQALVWHENLDGAGTLSSQHLIKNHFYLGYVASDFNGDGLIDIAAGQGNNFIWMENLGGGNFGAENNITINVNVLSTPQASDIDSDGDMDIIYIKSINSSLTYIVYLENNGSGGFAAPENLTFVQSQIGSLHLTDLDGDMDVDLMYSKASGSAKIAWIENSDGQGTFGSPVFINNNTGGRLTTGDIDGDGDLDILVAHDITEIEWLEHLDGMGTFGPLQRISGSIDVRGANDLRIVDIDNDGDNDVLVASDENSNLIWYENLDGEGDFGTKNIITDTTPDPNSAFPADLDNDGDFDIILSSDGVPAKGVSWLENIGLSNNRIQGDVTLDIDANGCSPSDLPIGNVMVTTSNNTETLATFTFANGYYQIYPMQEGEYTTEIVSLPSYFSSDPESHINQFAGVNNVVVADFCVAANQAVNDVNITMYPLNSARPGFGASYIVNFNNVGTTVLSDVITIEFDGSKMEFSNASEPVSSQTSEAITFDYLELNPFESRSIEMHFQVYTIPTTNIGDVLSFRTTIEPTSIDTTAEDNVFTFNQTVIGAYDPNDIAVLEGESIYLEDANDYLHYIIRFQNTGTASAQNVVVKNRFDEKLDWTTLKLEAISHSTRVEIRDENDLAFLFENINLPDSIHNEPESHGYISYKIKPKPNVVLGDIFYNKANIFFDFNPGIETNRVSTEIIEFLGTEDSSAPFQFAVYPNPAKNILYVNSKNKISSVQLFSNLGQLLIESRNSNTINLHNLISGIYILRVMDDNGNIGVRRVIKE